MKRRRMLEQRLGDLPQPLDPAGAREEEAVADHRIVKETLVGLDLLRGPERMVVLERHLRLREAHRHARLLGEEGRRDRARLAQVEGQEVRILDVRREVEHPPRWLAEPNRYRVAGAVKPLSG